MKQCIGLFLLILSVFSLNGQTSKEYSNHKELVEDFNFFKEKVEHIHPLLLNDSVRYGWENSCNELAAQLPDSLLQEQFYLRLSSLLAQLQDGHSFVNLPFDGRIKYNQAGGLVFPFTVKIIGDKLFVNQNNSRDSLRFMNHEEIISINSLSAGEILRKFRSLTGGKVKMIKNKMVEYYFGIFLWFCYGFEQDYQVTYLTKGDTLTCTVSGVKAREFFTARKNRYGQQKKSNFSSRLFEEYATAYIKIGSMMQLKEFCEFSDSTFMQIQQAQSQHLILDVRGNGGGRSIVADSLMNYLTDRAYRQFMKVTTRNSKEAQAYYQTRYPDRYQKLMKLSVGDLLVEEGSLHEPKSKATKFKGEIYLLTDEGSYSGAATFAGVFKELNLGTIIGQETGGRVEYFGDMLKFQLPNSKLKIFLSPRKFQQYGNENPNRGVVPDHLISLTPEMHFNEKDEVLEYTLNLIRSKLASH
ncbi:MAG: S41 family peptidase [Marinifilaceae bacterium]